MKNQSNPTVLHNRILNLSLAALFTALIVVCSWITVPLPAIPITLQLFGVFSALFILGGKYGTLSVVLYIALGAVGVPVFAGFRGGVGVLVGATGGYIAGFVVLALVYWTVTASRPASVPVKIAASLIGLFSCYAFGTAWYAFAFSKETGFAGVLSALLLCVVPYILPDLIKIALALAVSQMISKRIRITSL